MTPDLSNAYLDYAFAVLETNSDDYEAVGSFLYHGVLAVGAPESASAVVGLDNAEEYSVRIYDMTNVNVIAELVGQTDIYPAIKDLGALSNLPDGTAVFELQIKRQEGSPSETVKGSSVSFFYK